MGGLPMTPPRAHALKYVPEKSSIWEGGACLAVMVGGGELCSKLVGLLVCSIQAQSTDSR